MVYVVGMGEMGAIFARAFLKAGHAVVPVLRDQSIDEQIKATSIAPKRIVVAVGEADLGPMLDAIPEKYRDRVVLIQNELLPQSWERHGYAAPTVMSVWFEKKAGQDYKVIIPSPAYGPQADWLANCFSILNIPVQVLSSSEQLLEELIIKNLYILTANICGLQVATTVGKLWSEHEAFARLIVKDVLKIQSALVGKELDEDRLIRGMINAFDGDPDHKCLGRTASQRLERAIKIAEQFKIDVPHLKSILEE